ncbi:MAG: hypothetical protein ABIU30_08810 [Ferruginibacter sp.]
MPTVTLRKETATLRKAPGAKVVTIKKMRDYNKTPGLKKKAEDALAFLQKNGLLKKAKKSK